MSTNKHEANRYPESYDSLLIRCPRLGGEVTFAYCRVEGGALPCARIIQCWQVCLPIVDYLNETLAPEELERFSGSSPKEKIVTLVELIESARENKSNG